MCFSCSDYLPEDFTIPDSNQWKSQRESLLERWEQARPHIFEAFVRKQFISGDCINCLDPAVVR